MTKKKDILKELIETGADISGGVAGAVIGGLVAGPSGVIIGGVSGPVVTRIFKKVGTEIQQRFLSPREEVRIGAVYAFAINKIQENLKNNKSIRDDDFFESGNNSRPDSEEIFEGVVLGAQKEYEERKVKYLGNLYGNICTNSNITREYANRLIRTTNNLSYRQLCLLQLLMEKWEDNRQFKRNVIGLDDSKIEKGDVIIEIRDLQQRGLVFIVARINNVDDNSSPIPLDDITLSDNGRAYCELLSLNEIPRQELDRFNDEIN